MMDYCLRATAANGKIRAFVATTKNLVDEASRIHMTSAVASAALGRVLTAAAIMGLNLGNDDYSVTLSVKGDGDLNGVLAVSDGLGRVRGYVHNPYAHAPDRADGKLNVGGALGSGQLTVIMDLGLKEPYSGTVELVTGEIAEDLAHYYMSSEQTPSVISLGVLVNADLSIKQAGGIILQLMPGYSDALVTQLEEHIKDFPQLSKLLDEEKTPEDIMELLLAPFGYEILSSHPLEFRCTCSRGRVEGALISLGAHEIEILLQEQGEAVISCHFCNENYRFGEDDLREIIKGILME
ncbi:MAG: Hsp33 family molecular chaperone HslO [Defluviitaleaceae bacterium]|nr:Hsp33 family molecular chaperone HslO [Defluviitaleaceae bacterium]